MARLFKRIKDLFKKEKEEVYYILLSQAEMAHQSGLRPLQPQPDFMAEKWKYEVAIHQGDLETTRWYINKWLGAVTWSITVVNSNGDKIELE